MPKPKSPYPPNWNWIDVLNGMAFNNAAVFDKDITQISIADQCNLGEVNGYFTQTTFDAIWAKTEGNSSLPFSQQVALFAAALHADGIGTKPFAKAGTYLDE